MERRVNVGINQSTIPNCRHIVMRKEIGVRSNFLRDFTEPFLFLNGTSKNRKLDEFCVLRVFRWFIVGWKVYFFAKVSFGGECGNPTKDGPTEAQRSNGFGNNEGFKVRKRAIT